jgi:hypothetical protein
MKARSRVKCIYTYTNSSNCVCMGERFLPPSKLWLQQQLVRAHQLYFPPIDIHSLTAVKERENVCVRTRAFAHTHPPSSECVWRSCSITQPALYFPFLALSPRLFCFLCRRGVQKVEWQKGAFYPLNLMCFSFHQQCTRLWIQMGLSDLEINGNPWG